MFLNRKSAWLKVYNIVLFIIFFKMKHSQSFLQYTYEKIVVEEAFLNTEQLLQKYKYPVETHYVQTEDNYILGVHRMPKANGQPVLLMHGLLDSSAGWTLLTPKESLSGYLYDNGYDVWMGNARGNRYSRNHTQLNPNTDNAFWKFSWHEIGVYDLAAMIDYILEATGFEQLVYFGHSQGTTVFFVLCSIRPEYNDKILIMHALAPVAFCSHIRTPLLETGRSLLNNLGENEFPYQSQISFDFCLFGLLSRSICLNKINDALGPNYGVVDIKRYLPTILGHLPAGACIKQMKHYLQLFDSGKFAQYDFGIKENWKRYGHANPPNYPLENISAPVALYYTKGDYVSTVSDVTELRTKLPNVVKDHLLPYENWNHFSLIWGTDSREFVHKGMLELTNQMIHTRNDEDENSINYNVVSV